MCIIICKPRGVSIEDKTLETCFENNPDGAGYMFPCEGRLLIKKGYFTFEDFHAAWAKSRKIHGDALPVVFHFRIASSGEIDKANCHPHRIANDLGFVHNGILSRVTVPKESPLSDTMLYSNRYLRKLTGQSLRNARLFRAIGRHIGTGNKFVFMNGKGRIVICNEEQGTWKNRIWFSNSSYMSRFGFHFSGGRWLCEYCGKILVTTDELAEGACLECLDYFESDSAECGGCFESLSSGAHRTLGWCDDCGHAIYGVQWPTMLREAASLSTRDDIAECF